MPRDDKIQPWDSDHTALVHVLWGARREGLIPREVEFDALASFIMQSKWVKAVRLHAVESKLRELDPEQFKC